MTDEDLGWLSTNEVARRVRSGQSTAREMVAAALARIQQRNPPLNAVTEVFSYEALKAADDLDAQPLTARGRLAGVPVLVKDEFDIAGHVTTLGGRANQTPAKADSHVVSRVRQAGGIVVGRTAMPEFGQFPTTESRRYGVTRNPWDVTRNPGGSSGGSAAAVAAGMVPVALGADGGGSLRIPAAACGLVGLKPTRGLVSTAPLPEHWFSLVTFGGITRTVADTATLLDVVMGSQPTDRWLHPRPAQSLADQVAAGPGTLRVAWTTQSIAPFVETDKQVAAATVGVAADLAELGHTVSRWPRRLPAPTDSFLPQYYAGMRVEGAHVERPEALEPRTRQTIALSGWATDRVVDWALRRGEREAELLDDSVFAAHDVLVLPAMPRLIPPAGLLGDTGTVRAQAKTLPYVANTTLFNVTGHPAISIPGRSATTKWPIGVQLVTRRGHDGLLLALAAQLEHHAHWPRCSPID